MVRAKWQGTIAAVLLGVGSAWGQRPDGSTLASEPAQGSMITLQEPNQPKMQCKLLRSWRESNGAFAYEVQIMATGEKMTIVQAISGAEPPRASQETKQTQAASVAPAIVPAPAPAIASAPASAVVPTPAPAVISAPTPSIVSAPAPAIASAPASAVVPVPAPAVISAPTPSIVSAPAPAQAVRPQARSAKSTSTHSLVPLPPTIKTASLDSTSYLVARSTKSPAMPAPADTSFLKAPADPTQAPDTTIVWRQASGTADEPKPATAPIVSLPHANTTRPDPLTNSAYLESKTKAAADPPKAVPSYLKYEEPTAETGIVSAEEPSRTGGLLGVLRNKRMQSKASENVPQPPLEQSIPVAAIASAPSSAITANPHADPSMVQQSTTTETQTTSTRVDAPKNSGLLGRLWAKNSSDSSDSTSTVVMDGPAAENTFSPSRSGTTPGASNGSAIHATAPPLTAVASARSSIAPVNTDSTNIPSSMPAGSKSQEIVAMLHDAPFPSQREWAAETLAAAGWRANPYTVPALLRGAKEDPAATVRATCVRCLAQMKVRTSLVVGTLETLTNDANPRVRKEVTSALVVLAPTRTGPVMPLLQPAGSFVPDLPK